MNFNIIYRFLSDIYNKQVHKETDQFYMTGYVNPLVDQAFLNSINLSMLFLYNTSLDFESGERLYKERISIGNDQYVIVIPVLNDREKFVCVPSITNGNIIIIPVFQDDMHGCTVYDIFNIVNLLVGLEKTGSFFNPSIIMPFVIANVICYKDHGIKFIDWVFNTISFTFDRTLDKIDDEYREFIRIRGEEIVKNAYYASPIFKPEYAFNMLTNSGKLFTMTTKENC